MKNKKCFKCKKIKDICHFYKHKEMADGHLNKCKSCAKKDVKNRYIIAIEKITIYEKLRSQNPERRKKATEYQRTRRQKNSGKNKARAKISNAIRDGKLKKGVCFICGKNKTEAHHKDYRKPYDVVWLCRKHHMEIENKNYHG